VHVHIYTCTQIGTYIYIHIHKHMCVHTHILTRAYIQADTHSYSDWRIFAIPKAPLPCPSVPKMWNSVRPSGLTFARSLDIHTYTNYVGLYGKRSAPSLLIPAGECWVLIVRLVNAYITMTAAPHASGQLPDTFTSSRENSRACRVSVRCLVCINIF
jgi:hypothetical protein